MGLPSRRVPQEPNDSVQYDRTSESVVYVLYASPVLSFLDVGMGTGTIGVQQKVTVVKVLCSVDQSWASRGSQLLISKAQLVETVKFPPVPIPQGRPPFYLIPLFLPCPIPYRTYLTLHPVTHIRTRSPGGDTVHLLENREISR